MRYHLFVISSPSGGGKTTIIKRVIQRRPDIQYSISTTTRPIGDGEKDGSAYYFVTYEEFQEMIKNGRLIEYEKVHGHFYGTPKEPIENAVVSGAAMIFDLDVKGGLHMKELFPGAILIFLMPPSLEVLKRRLFNRKRESYNDIDYRLKNAADEMKAAEKYDYRVLNDDLDKAVDDVLAIIDSKRK
ncbi:MAG: guanylate kinase [candidate division Zixibacteria bacterium]|nr:guanylate kinase [Candidatus Tariuqbacter arcticus]